LQPRK